MRLNRVGLHPSLQNVKAFKRHAHGELDWMMHDSRKICFVIWKDKQPILLLSTYASPIINGHPMTCTVPRRDGANRSFIPTSPILFEYTTHMRGVNVADQLGGNYSWLSKSHKWWHRIFFLSMGGDND